MGPNYFDLHTALIAYKESTYHTKTSFLVIICPHFFAVLRLRAGSQDGIAGCSSVTWIGAFVLAVATY
jgi:hypothetical protein